MTRVRTSLILFTACISLFLAAGLSGCADNSTAAAPAVSTNGLTAGGATSLYSIQNVSSGSILEQFSLAGASTTLTPIASITSPTGFSFSAVAVDSAGLIYAGATSNSTLQGEILVYPAGSTTGATPSRTILGGLPSTTTTFGSPNAIQVNSAGTLAILSQTTLGPAVTTLPASSTGSVTPTTDIVGANALLTSPEGLAIDNSGKIYVTNYGSVGSIYEFASTATGNTAPITTITTGPQIPYGIAIDSTGNIITVLDSPTHSSPGSIVTYPSTASGAATPTYVIAGTTTGVYFCGGLRVDSVNNIYLINITSTNTFSYLAFKGGTTGNVSPPLTFTSTAITAPASEIAVH